MAELIYSLSILFIFQSIEGEYAPSLVGLMAGLNDPTSVYNNPGALGFLSNEKKFQINMLTNIEFENKKDSVHGSTYPQVRWVNTFISLYAFGFYFAVTSLEQVEMPIIAKRFGKFATGIKARKNSSKIGTLFVINDKFRVALSGNVIYDSMQIHGRGGFIYQPFDWYYIGIDVFPHLRKLKIINSFLQQPFGLDNISVGLEIDKLDTSPECYTFIQGVFSFKYLKLAVGWNSGDSNFPEVIEALSVSYDYTIICSLHFGF
jgi:hypothetical protein